MSVKGGDVIFNFKSDDKELQKSVNDMGTSIKKMVTALGLDKVISKTIGALNNSLDGAIKRVDTLNNFPRVMNNLGIATEDATESINELSEGLIGLPTTLNDGVSAVQRFTSQNNDVKKSTKMFLALNNAILAGGASTEVQASAMEQLSQAYAKGKPDAMEWRSMLTAMPAQLKQVAKAMGYTSTAVGGDLYNAIQKGKVSMDDFMGIIMKLNDQGVGEFASFAEQAKSSTGGIATSITNVKTAITRGLANSIEALNKSLKKANLPTVNDMIQKVGTTISKAFNKVNEGLGKIKWQKIIPIVKEVVQYMKNLKNTLLEFVKEVFKKIDWNTVLQIAPTILKIVGTFKVLNPLIKTTSSLIKSFGSVLSAVRSPAGLLITTLSALATAYTFFALNKSKEQQRLDELNKSIRDSTQEYKEYNKSVEDNMKKSVAQIDYTKSLNDELKTLVDENGKVKKGYEDRVKFILNQLNDALGLELKLVDGEIKGYQEQGREIDKLLRKKRAETILNGEYQKYTKGIEKQKEAYEKLNDMVREYGFSIDEMEDSLKGIYSDKILDSDKLLDWWSKGEDNYRNLKETIKTSTEDIKQYETDFARFEKENYSDIGRNITTSVEDWTDNTEQELKNNITEQEKNLKSLLDVYTHYNDDKNRDNVENGAKDLALLRSQLEARTKTVTQMTPQEIEAFIRLAQRDRNAFNDVLGQTSGDTRRQLENIGRAIDENGHIPEDKIRSVANAMASPIQDVSNNAYTWGMHFMTNLNAGIQNNKGKLFGTVFGIAEGIQKTLGHSHPKIGPMKDDPKWMPDFVQVLNKSLEASTPNLYRNINQMAGKMKEQLSLGLGMSPTLNNVASYNPSVNVTVQNNMETDFMGNLVSNIKTFSNGSKNDYNYGMS